MEELYNELRKEYDSGNIKPTENTKVKQTVEENTVLDNIFGLSNFPNLSKAIVNGIMEVTHGCVDLSIVAIKPYLCSIIACGLISFGGLSVHLQSIVFLTECKIKYKYFLLTKITHSLLSIGVCALLGLFIL